MQHVQTVLRIATKEIGVHEEGGNNQGERVSEYLRSVGLPAGNPWCAAFVAWVMAQAEVSTWLPTGDTWALDYWAKKNGILNSSPQHGDVFLLLGSDGMPMHTGFVERVEGSNVVTIEGNTGGSSDTDGDGVYRKRRPSWTCRFVRWAKLKPEQPLHVMLRSSEKDILVKCNPKNENGMTRVDLRALCDALGYAIDTQHMDDGILTLRKL